ITVSTYLERLGLARCAAANVCREATYAVGMQRARCSPCANRPEGPSTLSICVTTATPRGLILSSIYQY
ncbi:hypothetical protein BD311DRAFT_678610, partial [Dichomitus squalens]